jgi:hypothetical protein
MKLVPIVSPTRVEWCYVEEETKEVDDDIVVIFFTLKKNAKNKKGGGERGLLSSSHFCHHREAPLVKALLMLPAFETLMDFTFLKF